MRNLLVAIHLQPGGTRILAMSAPGQMRLKARLPSVPWNRKALGHLLQGLALGQGRPVRAVLVADGPANLSGMSLSGDCGDETAKPLYVLEHVPGLPRPPGGAEPGEKGRFAELAQLLAREAGR
jgi:hypothetical protein